MFTNLKKNHLGFSLIELMVVVSITSALVSLGTPKFNLFQKKAKQSEAKLNIDNIYTLIHAKEDQSLLEIHGSAITSGSALTANDYSTATSCHNNNALGFKVSNCQKVNYRYRAISDNPASGPKTHSALAIERQTTRDGQCLGHFSHCTFPDLWAKNEKSVGNFGDLTCTRTMGEIVTDAVSGGKGIDINGDGGQDLGDFLILSSLAAGC